MREKCWNWVGQEMAEPRKVFRIEETAAARLSLDRAPAALPHSEMMQAEISQAEILQPLGAARAAMAAPVPAAKAAGAAHGDTQRLGVEAAHLTRIAHELDAVVNGTEQATQKVLAVAEEIDQVANNLAAALNGRIEQGLAQDIQDLVIRIFEACNFHDLIGQRVTKVMATLSIVEHRIARAIEEIGNRRPARMPAEAAQYLHGPRLDIDHGHVTQSEIDAMLDG